jgi:cytochrome c-type biogenesis protein CcmH/NrfG
VVTDGDALSSAGWRGKHDAAGALATWQKLLKTNPELSADKKTTVEQHIAGDKRGKASLAAPVNGTKTQ